MTGTQQALTIPPVVAITLLADALVTKGYEVRGIEHSHVRSDIYAVRYFPVSLTKSIGNLNGSYEAVLENIGELPPAPDMDRWTRLSLELGPQGGIYREEREPDWGDDQYAPY